MYQSIGLTGLSAGQPLSSSCLNTRKIKMYELSKEQVVAISGGLRIPPFPYHLLNPKLNEKISHWINPPEI
jgi:hypothetical protein